MSLFECSANVSGTSVSVSVVSAGSSLFGAVHEIRIGDAGHKITPDLVITAEAASKKGIVHLFRSPTIVSGL